MRGPVNNYLLTILTKRQKNTKRNPSLPSPPEIATDRPY